MIDILLHVYIKVTRCLKMSRERLSKTGTVPKRVPDFIVLNEKKNVVVKKLQGILGNLVEARCVHGS